MAYHIFYFSVTNETLQKLQNHFILPLTSTVVSFSVLTFIHTNDNWANPPW